MSKGRWVVAILIGTFALIGSQFRCTPSPNELLKAPANLTYSVQSPTYTQYQPITNDTPSNTGGPVASYSIAPALPTGLQLDTTTGVISGTPTVAAVAATYTVTATNKSGNTTDNLSITVAAAALAAPTNLTYSVQAPSYTVGQPITPDTPSSSGGAVASYSVAPALPAGLALDTTTGIISGTPTVSAVAATYIVTATNATGQTTDSLSIAVLIAAPANLTYSAQAPSFTVGQPITPDTPSSTGGAVASYSVAPALPTGLVLDTTTGIISGTPTVAAVAATYIVTATNATGQTTDSLSIAVVIAAPANLTYSAQAPSFTVGQPITPDTPSSTGGAVASYSIAPALPSGLALDPTTGIISGTPTVAAVAASYTVTATNAGGHTTDNLSITVLASTASKLQLVLPPSVHPGDTWMQASVAPVQQGQAFAWSIVPGSATGTLTGTAGLDLDSFSAGMTVGTFQLQEVTGSTTLSGTVNVQTGTWLVEDGAPTTVRTGATATLLPSGRVLVVGGEGTYVQGFQAVLNSAELYDPATGRWFATGAMMSARIGHTASLLQDGTVLVAGGLDASGNALTTGEIFDPATGAWTATPAMVTAHYNHTATLLGDGTVLVAGGGAGSSNPSITAAEIYDPAARTWTATGAMAAGRQYHAAVALDGTHVLVSGGLGLANSFALATAEVYSSASKAWTATGSLGNGRYSHTATLLNNGNVMVAGGTAMNYAINSAELYATNLASPGTATWSATGAMAAARTTHAAVQLKDGSVMVVGGYDPMQGQALAGVEIYAPGSGTWTATGSLSEPRSSHTATVLADQLTVVVAGGSGGSGGGGLLGNSETYAGGTWTPFPGLGSARYYHTETVLTDGTVLVAGGIGAPGMPSSILYDPVTRTWKPTNGAMVAPRKYHTATLLIDGKSVLVTGGQDASGTTLSSSELYDVQSGTWTAVTAPMNAARQFHAATLQEDSTVLVTGGLGAGGALKSAELYDPNLKTWTAQPNMSVARYNHTATLVGASNAGTILVTGGRTTSGSPTNVSEIWTEIPGNWTTTGPLATARQLHKAVQLFDGTVLVMGGEDVNNSMLASAEVYTPGVAATAVWTTTGSMGAARMDHTATVLANGKVLVTGGSGMNGTLASTEIYTPAPGLPATATWAPAAPLAAARYRHTASLLQDGSVVVAFGYLGDVVTETFMPGP